MPAENVTITTTSSLLPVTVNIPRQLIMGQNSDFVISADNKGGEVIVEVPDKIEFTQSNKSQTIEGNISLSANKITADNPKIYGKITTNGFTAGTWKAAFQLKSVLTSDEKELRPQKRKIQTKRRFNHGKFNEWLIYLCNRLPTFGVYPDCNCISVCWCHVHSSI